jgi:glutaminyl-tRNA synthetase
MGAYIIKCENVTQDENGNITEIHCTDDLDVGNGTPTDRKVKGTIHWLSAKFAKQATVMLYEPLFTVRDLRTVPSSEYNDYLNPQSATKLEGCMIEPSLSEAQNGERFQFVRTGYFCKDTKHENTFNRIVGLRDSFKK